MKIDRAEAEGPEDAWESAERFTAARSTTTAGVSLCTMQQFAFRLAAGVAC
jgi:hypothetical protein